LLNHTFTLFSYQWGWINCNNHLNYAWILIHLDQKKLKTEKCWSSSLWLQTWAPNHKNLPQKFKMTMWHHHHCCNLHEKHYNVICCFYYHCYSTWRWWQWGWALIVENGKPMKAHIFDGDGVCNWQFFCQIVFVVAHQHKNTLRISYLKMPKKIQRCHVLGYGGPLKFFKFGWLLGLCLATKLYTHRGVTLLNYKDPPSHLSSNFEIHMPPFGSIPKGVTMNKWEHIIQNHLRILFNLKSKPKWVSYCKSTHVANYYPFSTTTFPMLKQKLI